MLFFLLLSVATDVLAEDLVEVCLVTSLAEDFEASGLDWEQAVRLNKATVTKVNLENLAFMWVLL